MRRGRRGRRPSRCSRNRWTRMATRADYESFATCLASVAAQLGYST